MTRRERDLAKLKPKDMSDADWEKRVVKIDSWGLVILISLFALFMVSVNYYRDYKASKRDVPTSDIFEAKTDTSSTFKIKPKTEADED